jgi:hypothetical protein
MATTGHDSRRVTVEGEGEAAGLKIQPGGDHVPLLRCADVFRCSNQWILGCGHASFFGKRDTLGRYIKHQKRKAQIMKL